MTDCLFAFAFDSFLNLSECPLTDLDAMQLVGFTVSHRV